MWEVKSTTAFGLHPVKGQRSKRGLCCHQPHCQPHISWATDRALLRSQMYLWDHWAKSRARRMLCHVYVWQRNELLLRWAWASVQPSAEGEATRLCERKSTQEVLIIGILFHYCFLTRSLRISTWWMGSVIMQLQEELMLLTRSHVVSSRERRVSKNSKIQLSAKTALQEATNTKVIAAPQNN